jgi:FkbM family methyltransferase
MKVIFFKTFHPRAALLLTTLLLPCGLLLSRYSPSARLGFTRRVSAAEVKEIEALPIVRRVDTWQPGVLFAQWEHPSELDKAWPAAWTALLETLLAPGCNVVDIGAHGGDTSIPLAVASRGGAVVALEMGPPIQILRLNTRLNPQLQIHVHHMAISDTNGTVGYQSECSGCNGGIGQAGQGESVPAGRLHPFLASHHPDLLPNICLVKIDTEGHDTAILGDLANSGDWRPGLVWVEWFAGYKKGSESQCSKGSEELFATAERVGYSIFKPSLPLEKVESCQNR